MKLGMAVFNISSIKTASDGVWQGDNPLNYAFPLLIAQTILVLFTSRCLAFLLKPLRQPKVIAEILGGIVLGPSACGRNKEFTRLVFPSWSTPILESVASIGLLFFLFLVGLELDLPSIRRSGRRAFTIAAAGISLPFALGAIVELLLQKVIHFNNDKGGYIQHFMFMGVSLSITAFPVLARILAELKLLTTQVGETAMAAAAFNDLAAWILLALAVALAGHKSALVSVWVVISGVAFVALMLIVIRPVMNWVARQCSREHEVLDEAYVSFTLAGVMLSGFVTDLIGIHSIFGAFIFGLTIPKGGEFADRITKRIEDFVTTMLLPLYFASSGLKTNVGRLHSVGAWGILLLIITTACAGKILGTFLVAMLFTMTVRESLTLGVLMNTKGLVELIVLNIGREKKILTDDMFAILVLMAIFTTFMTTPVVMTIYKPLRNTSPQVRHRQPLQQTQPPTDFQGELRILACIHGPGNVPSLINFIELVQATKKSSHLDLYVMRLVELTHRSSSILMARCSRKNGFPFVNRFRRGAMHDQIVTAFEAYSQVGQVSVHHLTSVSALTTMHEDIYHVAEEKRAAMIILPFHKLWKGEEEKGMENMGQSWRQVNQSVLESAPCPVAVLVSRGSRRWCKRAGESSSSSSSNSALRRLCIIFAGGPDDRKVLELGSRMAEHPEIRLVVVRLMINEGEGEERPNHNLPTSTANLEREKEQELDEVAISEFRRKHESVDYIEKDAGNITEEVLTIGKANEYELFIVGKGQDCLQSQTTTAARIKNFLGEHPELGLLGDILTSAGQDITSSVLVVQDQDLVNSNKNMTRDNSTVITDAITGIESSV